VTVLYMQCVCDAVWMNSIVSGAGFGSSTFSSHSLDCQMPSHPHTCICDKSV